MFDEREYDKSQLVDVLGCVSLEAELADTLSNKGTSSGKKNISGLFSQTQTNESLNVDSDLCMGLVGTRQIAKDEFAEFLDSIVKLFLEVQNATCIRSILLEDGFCC